MRIISKSHDYYDGVQRQCFSKEPIYFRESKTEGFDFKNFFPTLYSSWLVANAHVYAVGFCGRVFPLLRMTYGYYSDWEDRPEAICYNFNEAKAFLDSLKVSATVRNNMQRRDYKEIYRFFEEFKQEKGQWQHLFKAPIFITKPEKYNGEDGEIEYNGCLSQLEFYRVYDCYTAFQEIEMWLCNQAVPQKPILVPSDEVIVEIKGFDKFSFRKPKKVKSS